MDQAILEIRCGTLREFLNKIDRTESVSDKLRIGIEASRIAERIIYHTDHSAFLADDYVTILANLEHYSLAVFMNQTDWAHESLDNIIKMCTVLF